MLAKFAGVKSERTVFKFRKRKKCVVFTHFIKRAPEIRKFLRRSRATTTTAKKCTKKRNARAKLLF